MKFIHDNERKEYEPVIVILKYAKVKEECSLYLIRLRPYSHWSYVCLSIILFILDLFDIVGHFSLLKLLCHKVVVY